MPELDRSRRRLLILLTICSAAVSMGCLGWNPPLQTVAIDGALGSFSPLGGRWFTVDSQDFEPDLVIRSGLTPELSLRLPWGADLDRIRLDGDRLRLTAIAAEGVPMHFELTRVEGHRLALMRVESGQPMWRSPWTFERVSAFEMAGRRATLFVTSAYDEAIDWLASVF